MMRRNIQNKWRTSARIIEIFFAVAAGIVMVREVGFMETSYLSASAIAKKIAGLIQLDSETVLVFSLMVFSSMFLINLSHIFLVRSVIKVHQIAEVRNPEGQLLLEVVHSSNTRWLYLADKVLSCLE